MPRSEIKGCFFFKASHAQELMEEKSAQTIHVEVVRVIQLSAQQFHHFSANLLRDMPFLTPYKGSTSYNNGVTRCLLVTTERRQDGILVNCEGYDYARYSCYVCDRHRLDLRDVPVEHYGLKRQPHDRQVR